VDFADTVRRDRTAPDAASINPFLDCDMRLGFDLEVALVRVQAIVVLQSAVDIHWMRVVPFD